jgi:competence ComEA-like helix-hairpin-helix protein
MGGTQTCLPSPIDKLYTLRRRRYVPTQAKPEQAELNIPNNANNNNNNNLINLNHASEDELLMLPGITRQIAQDILQYRQVNQDFKQINELLYITGINHDLFERIRSDVSVDSSLSSSRNLSTHKQSLINLNLATYDELSTIPSLAPILITRIIQRRERKGAFRFVEDLLKIKGIDYVILASIRSYITVDYPHMPLSISESSILNPSVHNY